MTLDHSPLSDIQIRPDVNGSDGYSGTRIVGRSPEGGVDPEADLVANQDFWKKLADTERMPFQMRLRQVAGNTVRMLAPSAVHQPHLRGPQRHPRLRRGPEVLGLRRRR